MHDDVFIPNWCVVQGVRYEKHQIVVVGKYQDDNDPIFGKISEIVLDDSRTWLVLQMWHTISFKGEIRNRFNLILKERVKKFEENSENLMKIG